MNYDNWKLQAPPTEEDKCIVCGRDSGTDKYCSNRCQTYNSKALCK